MRPDDMYRETSVDWGMNRLTEGYLKGEIKTLVWGAVLNDGSFRTCYTKGNFLERLGLCACLAEDIHASARNDPDNEEISEEEDPNDDRE